MNKKIIIGIIVVIALVIFFFPKDAGEGSCGMCPPKEIYRWEEQSCLGFKQIYQPCDDCPLILLCYGFVYGEKVCYNSTYEPKAVISCEQTQQLECTTDNDCTTGGCSSQLCGKKGEIEDIITSCEWSPEYGCLEFTSCKCIENKCQFEETPEHQECMTNISQ